MKDFAQLIEENLGVKINETFYIKVELKWETAYKKHWLPVKINSFGRIIFVNENDNPYKDTYIVCFAGADKDDCDEDFFWRVTVGDLLSQNISFKKELTLADRLQDVDDKLKAVIYFCNYLGVKYIKKLEIDDKNIIYVIGNYDNGFVKGITSKTDETLYQYIDCLMNYFKIKVGDIFTIPKREELFD